MNFIYMIPDELRAESVGCYGHPLVQTPNIDAFAAQGTRFDQCHVQHTVCSPSRCSLMTGWYPHVRGHRTLWHLLRPDEPNLLRYLKQAGYDVRWYGKNDLLSQASFAESVTSAESFGGRPFNFPFVSPGEPDAHHYSFLGMPIDGPLEQHTDYANVMAAIQYLKSKPDRPFMIYLPLLFPHPPYSAPVPWHTQIDPDAIPPLRPANLPNRPTFFEGIRRTRGLDQLSEADFRQINAVYLGMTGYMDYLFGMLLDALAESGLEEETAVFFFSDHGDYAGDYGLVEKWPSGLEDVLTRIPLMARIPGGQAEHVVREPVEMFDVMATTLELAGIQAEHTHFARSLLPQLQGAPGDPERLVFAEGGYARHEPHAFEGRSNRDQFARDRRNVYFPKGALQQEDPDSVGRVTMLRSATHKLIYRPTGVTELYDLQADPLELNNVAGDPACADLRHSLEGQMLNWLVQTSDVVPFDIDPRGLH